MTVTRLPIDIIRSAFLSKYSRVPFLLFCLFISSFSVAQQSKALLDSLKAEPIDSLVSWMETNFRESVENFLPVANFALSSANTTKDYRLIGDVHDKMASWHAFNGFFPADSVLYHSEKVVANYELLGDQIKLANALKTISIDYINVGDNESSLKANMKALEIFEDLGDESGIAGTYKNLSSLFARTGEPQKSLEYGMQAIEMYKRSENHASVAITYLNLIAVYNSLEDYEEALNAANTCLEIVEKEVPEEIFVAVRAYAFRHNTYLKMKNYPLALADAKKAWQISVDETDEERAAGYRVEIGNVLLKQEKFQEALPHLEAGVKAYEASGSYNISEPYYNLYDCYKALGIHEKALNFQDLAFSIDRKDYESRIENLKSEGVIKYETGKKDQEIALQDQQLKQKTRIQFLVLGIASLLGLMLVILFANFKKNRKITKELGKKNSENELLLKEIHHRVKNNLQTISSLLSLQSESIVDPTAFDAVQESKNRVASMALIHQKLYQGENLAAVEMKDYFETIGTAIKDSFGEKGKSIELNVDMAELEIDVDTAVPIGLITNELLTNSFKHAFSTQQKGSININLSKSNDNLLRLEISDNGSFIESEDIQKKESGFGSLLIQLLSTQLGGEMTKSTENGTSVVMKFREQEKSVA